MDAQSAILFEIKSRQQDIQTKLRSSNGQGSSSLTSAIAEVDGLLRKAATLTFTPPQQAQLRTLQDTQARLKGAASTSGGTSAFPAQQPQQEQRERLTQGATRLVQTTDRIKDAHRTAIQAEETGAGILSALHSQRKTLEGAQRTMEETSENMKENETILKRMGKWWRLGM